MTRKPISARRIWVLFACQIIMVSCIVASLIAPTVILLHLQEKSNQDMARLLPKVRQEIQNEQDPTKLKTMASAFFEQTVNNGTNREEGFRLLVKISVAIGVSLFICGLGSGICGYKIGRQIQEKNSSP